MKYFTIMFVALLSGCATTTFNNNLNTLQTTGDANITLTGVWQGNHYNETIRVHDFFPEQRSGTLFIHSKLDPCSGTWNRSSKPDFRGQTKNHGDIYIQCASGKGLSGTWRKSGRFVDINAKDSKNKRMILSGTIY